MKCPNCGNDLIPGALFCASCGNKIPEELLTAAAPVGETPVES